MDTVPRPRFFEGQYIGADDLEAIVAYNRTRLTEHLLGGHVWGIVAGLDLVERDAPGGGTEIWLQPGYAWDGYGRAIVVTTAQPLSLDQLSGKPTGAWFVWLSFRETEQDAARPSYGVCEGEGAFRRVAEGFEIVISGQLRLDEQRSGVLAGGLVHTDARLMRRLFDPNGPFLCDASIPEQGDPPLAGRSRWLVPVGLVGWDNPKQQIVALSPPERRGARLFRRHAGIVAEELLAPGGLIRLRNRLTWATAATPDVDKACASLSPLDSDLHEVDGRVAFQDLVWVEGAMRVLGHTRLFGGKLELRDAVGAEPQGPFFLRRKPAQPGDPQDLELAIGGPPGAIAPNRLVVGPARAPTADPLALEPVLTVRADGTASVGTGAATGLALEIKGDFGRDDGPATIHLKNSRVGDAGDDVLSLTSGGSVINLGGDGSSNDRVGIRTKTPAADLVLEVNGPVGITSGPAVLRLLGSELRDQVDGILRIRSGGGTVTFDGNDQVGIGTANPRRPLHVEPSEIHSGGGGGGFSFADRFATGFVEGPSNGERWVWYAEDKRARLWSGGDKLTVTHTGNLGIGTGSPAAALHVAGAARVDGAASVGGAMSVGGDVHIGGDLDVDGTFPFSDVRLKRNIEPIEGALGRLLELRGVSFEWASPDRAEKRPGRQIGLVADEVERHFPQWVKIGEDGYKRLGTIGLEALLIEAIRELSQKLEALEAENRQLRKRLSASAPAPDDGPQRSAAKKAPRG